MARGYGSVIFRRSFSASVGLRRRHGGVAPLPAACLLAACLMAAPTVLSAQSLVGNWASPEPILVLVRFSLTFLESEYRIECSLGQTLGTWFSTDTEIHFTPTSVGINNSVGKFDVWNYKFVDEDNLILSTGLLWVRLTRNR